MGGLFVDHPTGRRFAPSHNALVAFSVPRLHEVTRVATERPRYSVFGWLYFRRADIMPTGRGAAAAATLIFRRRRGRDAETQVPAGRRRRAAEETSGKVIGYVRIIENDFSNEGERKERERGAYSICAVQGEYGEGGRTRSAEGGGNGASASVELESSDTAARSSTGGVGGDGGALSRAVGASGGGGDDGAPAAAASRAGA